MKHFLHHTAEKLLADFGDALHQQFIILPNERPALFLRKSLSEITSKPLLAPNIVSIERLVFDLTGLQKASPTETLFRLFEAFKACEVSDMDLEKFLNIGQTILTDFYETDLYLANAKDLFRYLSDIRKIEQWTPDNPGKDNYASAYIKLYESLGKVYEYHRSELLKNGMADPALAFRQLAENRETLLAKFFQKKSEANLIFVGFNALTPCELQFMRFAKRMNKARFFWDADDYYVSNTNQEAGYFLRDMDSELLSDTEKKNFPKNIGQHPLEIDIVETTGNLQQVLYAAEKISAWNEEQVHENEKVGIVLGDESLISDLIEVLPKNAKVNLTLGVGLHTLLAGSLIFAVSRLHRSASKNSWYHRDLVRVLQHPFISTYLKWKNLQSQEIIDDIRSRNLIRIDFEEMRDKLAPTDLEMLWKSGTALEVIRLLEQGFTHLAEAWNELKPANENYEREQSYAAVHLIREARGWIEKFIPDLPLRLMTDMLWQLTQGTTVNFKGEPETGIQIMGILETRLLNFDRLVVLSTNEEIIPKGKTQSSLIPNDVKQQFDLPRHTHRDAIFAYHFYHAFHTTKQADILYVEGQDSLGSAGPSRFIYQMRWEWSKMANISVREILYHSSLQDVPGKEILIPESAEISDILQKRFAEKGISPSGIVKYLRNPLEFYKQYVLGIREDDNEVEEQADARLMGNAVHNALEDLYRPHIGNPFPHKEHLLSMKKRASAVVREKLQNELNHSQLDEGHNIIALTAAEEMTKNAIDTDLHHLDKVDRRIVALENKYSPEEVDEKSIRVPLDILTPYGPVMLNGKIDRLEEWDNHVVYLDYKTGSIPSRLQWDGNFENTPPEKQAEKYGAAIQLLCYSLLADSGNKNFKLGLMGLKTNKPESGFTWLKTAEKNEEWTPQEREDFRGFLTGLVREIIEGVG